MEPLPDDAVDDDPGEDETGEQVGLHAAHMVDTVRDAQHLVAEIEMHIIVNEGHEPRRRETRKTRECMIKTILNLFKGNIIVFTKSTFLRGFPMENNLT